MASESYGGNNNIPEKHGEDVNDIPLGEQSEKSAACLKVEPTTNPGTVSTAVEDSSCSNSERKLAPTDCRLMSNGKNHSSSSTEATEHLVEQTKANSTRPEVEEKPSPMNSPLQRAKKSLLGSEANATVISEVGESPNLPPSESDEVKIETTAESTKQPSEQTTKQCIKGRDDSKPMSSLSQPDQNSLANSNADSVVNVTVEPAEMLLCKSEDVKVESTTKFIEQPAEQIAVGTPGLSVTAVPPRPKSPLMQFYFPDDEPNEPLVNSSIADAPVVDGDVAAAQLPLCKSEDAKVESTTKPNEQPAELVKEDTEVPNDELPAEMAKEGITDPSDVRPLPPKSPPLPNETWLEGATTVSVINGAIETAELPLCKSEDAKVESTTKLSDEPFELAQEYAAVPDDVVRVSPPKSPPLPNHSWRERLSADSFMNDAIEITRLSSCTSEDAKVESTAKSAEQPAEMVKENTAFPNGVVRSPLPKLPPSPNKRWHDGLTADSITSYAIETAELAPCNSNDSNVELNSESSEQPAEMAKDDTAVPSNTGRPSPPKSPPLSKKSSCEGLTADSVTNYAVETAELAPCNSNDSNVESTSKSLEQPAEMAKKDTAVLNDVGKPSPPKSPPLPNKRWREGLTADSVTNYAVETTELAPCNSNDSNIESTSKSLEQPAEIAKEDTAVPSNTGRASLPKSPPLSKKSSCEGLTADSVTNYADETAELAPCNSNDSNVESTSKSLEQPAEMAKKDTAVLNDVGKPSPPKSPPLPNKRWREGLTADSVTNYAVETAELAPCNSNDSNVESTSKSLEQPAEMAKEDTAVLNDVGKPSPPKSPPLPNKRWREGLTADSVTDYAVETAELAPCNSNDSNVESTSKSLEQPAEMAKEDTAVLNDVGKPSPPKSPPLPNKSWCEGLKAASSVIDNAVDTAELPSCNSEDAKVESNGKSSDQPAELVDEEDTIILNNVGTPSKSPLPNKSCHKGLAASAAELPLCASENDTNEPAEIVTEVTASGVVEPPKSKSPPMKFYLSTNLPKEKLKLLIAGLNVDVTVTINDVVENADLSCKSECSTVKFSSKSLRRSTDGTSSGVTSVSDTNYPLLPNEKSEVSGGSSGTGSVHSDQQEETPQISGSQPVEFSCNPQSKKASNKTLTPQSLSSPQFGEQLKLVREQQNKKPFESTPGDEGKMSNGLQISDGLEASTPKARVHIIPSPEKEDTMMLDSVSEQLGQISVSPFCPSLADLTVECDKPFLSDNRPSLGEEFHEDVSHKFIPSPLRPPPPVRFSRGSSVRTFLFKEDTEKNEDSCFEHLLTTSSRCLSEESSASPLEQGQELDGGAPDAFSRWQSKEKNLTNNQVGASGPFPDDVSSKSETADNEEDGNFSTTTNFITSDDYRALLKARGKRPPRLRNMSLLTRFDPLVDQDITPSFVTIRKNSCGSVGNEVANVQSESVVEETCLEKTAEPQMSESSVTPFDSSQSCHYPTGSPRDVNAPAKTVETEVSDAYVEHSDSSLASFNNQARVNYETILQLKKYEKMILSLTDQLRKATKRRSAAGRREILKQPGTRDLPEVSSDRVKELESDLSQTQQHLENMEVVFNDLHQKYQKSKEVIAKYKENEIALKKYGDSAMENLEKQKQSYEKFKTMAIERLNKANKEIARIRAEFTTEVNRQKNLLKKNELVVKSLEEKLKVKEAELAEMSALCEEIILKKS